MKHFSLYKLVILLVIQSTISTLVYSQIAQDNELWTGLTLKHDLNDNWRLDFEEELRFDEGITKMKTAFSEIGLRRRLTTNWTIKANYRYSIRPQKSNKDRWNLDLSFDKDIGQTPFQFDYRLRGQSGRTIGALNRRYEIRNRLQLKAKFSKTVRPSIGTEWLYSLSKSEFRQYRLSAGVEFRISKKLDVEVLYHYQREFNVQSPALNHIFGVQMAYEIGRRNAK